MPRQSIKPFLTYSQQLTKLAEDKKLLIPDSASAKNALTSISYYALIGGYK
ncbi:MAG: hypothetical protein LIO75_06460 [Lachnospiraceae bacterium]|nr:hypothetical protein [Lachnospiraceae bacterium]